jgi:hypothetical protein
MMGKIISLSLAFSANLSSPESSDHCDACRLPPPEPSVSGYMNKQINKYTYVVRPPRGGWLYRNPRLRVAA